MFPGLRSPSTPRSTSLAVGLAAFLLVQPVRVPQQPTSIPRHVQVDQPLGKISFPTSGSAAAQPSFIRGVLLLHSFEYDEAIEAFRTAEKADPSFAMAYWGEAMCYNQSLWENEQPEKARAALGRLALTPLARQAKAPTAREKSYLDAVEKLVGEGDKPTRYRAYADRMAALSRQFPDDDEAAAFYALALLGTISASQPNQAVSLKAGEIASAILKRNPQHPGAAHYALHAYDDGEHAALGLEAARTYARLAPASSHARHMPSHVFLPLGMWDEAAASDESAFAASVDAAKRKRLSAAQFDFHSLSWLHYEYLQQGRFTKAKELLQPVTKALEASAVESSIPAGGAGQPHAASEHGGATEGGGSTGHGVESEIGRGYGQMSLKSEAASMRARWVLETRDWAAMKGQGTFDNIDELFALGVASVYLGDGSRGAAALGHLADASKSIPDRDAREVAAIMEKELEGLQRLGRGDRAGALTALAEAVSLESKRPRPNARPYPDKPAGELYAEILLAIGNAPAAITQFQTALARTPRRAASLIGLARAEEVAGNRTEAAKVAREFLQIWHLADTDRPELKDAKRIASNSTGLE